MFHAPIHTPPRDMTFTALRSRADETIICDTVADYTGVDPRLPGADLREVTVFLTHEQDDLGEDYGYRLHAKEIIGAALCDVDDPFAVPEILDRDQAWELLGRDFIEAKECVE